MKAIHAMMPVLFSFAMLVATPGAPAKDDATPAPGACIIDALKADGHYTTFLKMLDETQLSAEMHDKVFTVFAPTDEALQKYGNLGALRADREGLKAVLNNHLVADTRLSSNDLKTVPKLITRGGAMWTVHADGKLVNDAKVVQPDLSADNGTIHGIDQLLMKNAEPGHFNER